MENSYIKLATAIVYQACRDYDKALRKLSKNPDNQKYLLRLNECIIFFTSDWFKMITNLDGNEIMRRIDDGDFIRKHGG